MKRLRIIVVQRGSNLTAEFVGEDSVAFDRAWERIASDPANDCAARWIYPMPSSIRFPAKESADAKASAAARKTADKVAADKVITDKALSEKHTEETTSKAKIAAEEKARVLQAASEKANRDAAAFSDIKQTITSEKKKS